MQATQICLLASTIAKGGTGMVSLAGQMLNVVLEDLKRNRDLKMNRVTQSLTISPSSRYGPYTLEGNYLRTYDLWYPMPASGGGSGNPGLTMFLRPVTMEQWDSEFKDPQLSNYPYEFATDLSTAVQVWDNAPTLPVNTTPGLHVGQGNKTSAGQLFIYPASSGVITLTHRYMIDQPDIVTPETSTQTPWFTFTKYLIDATAALMMGITGDDRRPEYEARSEEQLRPYLIMEGDEQQAVHHIELDPRHFHFSKGLKPTKSSPL